MLSMLRAVTTGIRHLTAFEVDASQLPMDLRGIGPRPVVATRGPLSPEGLAHEPASRHSSAPLCEKERQMQPSGQTSEGTEANPVK